MGSKWLVGILGIFLVLITIYSASASTSIEIVGIDATPGAWAGSPRSDCAGVWFRVNQTMNLTKVCVVDGVTATNVLLQLKDDFSIVGNWTLTNGCADLSATPYQLNVLAVQHADYILCTHTSTATAYDHKDSCGGTSDACDFSTTYLNFMNVTALRVGCYSGAGALSCSNDESGVIHNIKNLTLSNEGGAPADTPPYWSDFGVNDTEIYVDGSIKASANWTDDNTLSFYITSYFNTTAWYNNTESAFVGNQTDLIMVLNNTGDWQFKIFANDSADNWNVTSVLNISVLAIPPETFAPQWREYSYTPMTVHVGDTLFYNSTWDDNRNLSTFMISIYGATSTYVWQNDTTQHGTGDMTCVTDFNDTCFYNYESPAFTAATDITGSTSAIKMFVNDTSNNWNVTTSSNINVWTYPPTFQSLTQNATQIWVGGSIGLTPTFYHLDTPHNNISIVVTTIFKAGVLVANSTTSVAIGNYSIPYEWDSVIGGSSTGTYNWTSYALDNASQRNDSYLWADEGTFEIVESPAPSVDYGQNATTLYLGGVINVWANFTALNFPTTNMSFTYAYILNASGYEIWNSTNATVVPRTLNNSLTFTHSLGYGYGTYTWLIRANDSNGNWNTTEARTFYLNRTPLWFEAYFGYDSFYGVNNFRFPTILALNYVTQKNYYRNPNLPIIVGELDGDGNSEELVTFGKINGLYSAVRIYENSTLDLIGSYEIADGSLSNAVIFANYSGDNTNSLLFAVEASPNPQLYEIKFDLTTGDITNTSTNITEWFDNGTAYYYSGGQLALGCNPTADRECYLFFNKYNYSEYSDYTSGNQTNSDNILGYIIFNTTGNTSSLTALKEGQNTTCFSKYRNVPFYDYDEDGADEFILTTIAMNAKLTSTPWWCVPPLSWILGPTCGTGSAGARLEEVRIYAGGEFSPGMVLGNYISWSQNQTYYNPVTGLNETVSGYNVTSGLSTFKSYCYYNDDPAPNRLFSDASSAVSNTLLTDTNGDLLLDLVFAASKSQWDDYSEEDRDFYLVWMSYPYNASAWELYDKSGYQGDFSNVVEANVYQSAIQDGEVCAYGFRGEHSGIMCARTEGGKRTSFFELDGNTPYTHDMTTSLYSIRSNLTYDTTENQNLSRFVMRTGILQPIMEWFNFMRIEYNYSLSEAGYEMPIISPIVDSGYSDLVVLTSSYLYYLDDGAVNGAPTATWSVTPCFVEDGAYTDVRQWQKMSFSITGQDNNLILPNSPVLTNATIYYELPGGHGNYTLDLYEDNDEFQLIDVVQDNSGLGVNGLSIWLNITDPTGFWGGFSPPGTATLALGGVETFPESVGVANDTFVTIWEPTTPTVTILLNDTFGETDSATLTYLEPQTLYVNNGTGYTITFVGMGTIPPNTLIFNLTTPGAVPADALLSIALADDVVFNVGTEYYNWSITILEREYPTVIYSVDRTVLTYSDTTDYNNNINLLNFTSKLNWTGDWSFRVCVDDVLYSTCYDEEFTVAETGTEYTECWTASDYELYSKNTVSNDTITDIITAGIEDMAGFMKIGMTVLWIIVMIIFAILTWFYLYKTPVIAGIVTFVGILILNIIGVALHWISGGIFALIMIFIIGAGVVVFKGKLG